MRSGVVKSKTKAANVAFVRLKKAGERLEVQVYRDKFPAADEQKAKGFTWDLETLMAVRTIFSNAAKGEAATEAVLTKCFEGLTADQMLVAILEKGELLATQEDRAASTHETAEAMAALAAKIASRAYVRPAEKPKTGRFERYTADQVERALKNIRSFRATGAAGSQVADDINRGFAALVADGFPILRDAAMCTLIVDKLAAPPATWVDEAMGHLHRLAPKAWRRLPSDEAEVLAFLLDREFIAPVKADRKLTLLGAFRAAEAVHWPSSTTDDLAIEETAAGAAAAAAGGSAASTGEKPKAKKGAKGAAAAAEETGAGSKKPAGKAAGGAGASRRGAGSLADDLAALGKDASDDDDDEDEDPRMKSALAKALKAPVDDDDDDDDRRGSKKKKKPAPKAVAPAPKASPAAPKPAADDDDDVVSSRKARKGAAGKVQACHVDPTEDDAD